MYSKVLRGAHIVDSGSNTYAVSNIYIVPINSYIYSIKMD